ncbi:hypothetical protein [Streptomyces sp. Tue6028]
MNSPTARARASARSRDERATVVDLDEPPPGQELGAAPAVRGLAARV